MLLSIIVPMFNSSVYLDNLFASVEKGFNKDMELILVNDGSTDDTLEKCIAYAQNRTNIYIVNNTNHGVSYSRNCGIEKASGMYLMFLDSDDILADGWRNTILEGITDSDEADIIVFSKDAHESNPDLMEILQCIMGIRGKLSCNYLGTPWSKVFRKDHLININILFDEYVFHGEDALFNIKAFISAKSFHFVQKSIYIYRINRISVTHKYDKRFLSSNERYLSVLQELLRGSEIFSEMMVQKCVHYSFVNSVYIFAGKVSKLRSNKERKSAIKDFYSQQFYSSNLKRMKHEKELPLSKKIIYLMIIYRMFGLVEFIITLVRRKVNDNEYYLIQI